MGPRNGYPGRDHAMHGARGIYTAYAAKAPVVVLGGSGRADGRRRAVGVRSEQGCEDYSVQMQGAG